MHFDIFTSQKSNTFVEIIQKILVAQLGFEPTTSRSEVDRANHYTIEASYKKGQNIHVEPFFNRGDN